MQKFDVNKLRVASLCSVGWETMTGDERVRHCHACQLNIYNTAEMTTVEVQNLIETREGRLCIRMFRRADGTVLTKDCPIGLRAVRRRVSTFAGAAMSAVLGLFSVSFGQTDKVISVDSSTVKITRVVKTGESGKIIGTVLDQGGAIIPGVNVTLSTGKKVRKFKTDFEGSFVITDVSEGSYSLQLDADGFLSYRINNIVVANDELEMTLELRTQEATLGIFSDTTEIIDLDPPKITNIILRRPNK